ncbi:hypothetical protein [Photobacterium galatheae]|uniref:Uncharacterized protein n=1 Tax=Photobacterium galatheae TaxID=1654360 RepID=A0A066S042_9GAMM|nr:hypothetical protein [Photobacterium galatheae]KDM93302.1 hypothetical protein EA58_01445 [Photobacterium galatheae]MCM0150426.1 hypothetical protein [Photobacterium galatheae]
MLPHHLLTTSVGHTKNQPATDTYIASRPPQNLEQIIFSSTCHPPSPKLPTVFVDKVIYSFQNRGLKNANVIYIKIRILFFCMGSAGGIEGDSGRFQEAMIHLSTIHLSTFRDERFRAELFCIALVRIKRLSRRAFRALSGFDIFTLAQAMPILSHD